MNVLAIAVAAVAAFAASGAWYGVLDKQLKNLSPAVEPKPMAMVVPVELARNLVLAIVLAGLVTAVDIEGLPGALLLGVVLWVGFPVVLLSGSVFHENVPWKLAALHAGDWLVKLLVISAIIGLWR